MLCILDLQPERKSRPLSKPASEPVTSAAAAQTAQPQTAASTSTSPLKSPTEATASTSNEAAAPAQKSGTPTKSFEPAKKSSRPAPRTSEVPVSEPVNIPEEPAVVQAAEEAAVEEAEEGEFEIVLGRRQIASWLFVVTVVIAVFSAGAFYAGRLSAPDPLAELDGKSELYIAPAADPSAVPAPVSSADSSVTPSAPAPLPEATIVLPGQDPILPAQIPASPRMAAGTNTTTTSAATTSTNGAAKSATAAKTGAGTNSGAGSVSPVLSPAPVSPGTVSVSSAPATSLPLPAARDWNKPVVSGEAPLFANPRPGGLYLQMGAVDKGIAVVLAEGLRRHGFNSIVAPGPTDKIFRVLIGPFDTQDDFKRAQAEVDAIDLGTFARRFQK